MYMYIYWKKHVPCGLFKLCIYNIISGNWEIYCWDYTLFLHSLPSFLPSLYPPIFHCILSSFVVPSLPLLYPPNVLSFYHPIPLLKGFPVFQMDLNQDVLNATEGDSITLAYYISFAGGGSFNIPVDRIEVSRTTSSQTIAVCHENNTCEMGDDNRITRSASFGDTINVTVVINNARRNDTGVYIAAPSASFVSGALTITQSPIPTATISVFVSTTEGEHGACTCTTGIQVQCTGGCV